ncbi:MAG: RHS repeat-associated core domain-containing protein [Saprospiraceae bacterium]
MIANIKDIDHLGSSTIISNGDGIYIQHIEYTAFGETFADWRTKTYDTPYRFTGKEQDSETGLYYYGARYYDPRLGRFLSVDPLAEKYGAWSPYAYTFDNPMKFNDPTGMWPDDPPIGAIFGGTIRSAINNIAATIVKYSNTPIGAAMRAANISVHYGVYEDPNSEVGVSVAYELVQDASLGGDLFNVFSSSLDLASLIPGEGRIVLCAKTPGMFSSEFLKTASTAFKEAYSGGKNSGFLNNVLKTEANIGKSIKTLEKRIADHKSYIKDPTIKYGDSWKTFSETRKADEINHWKTEIKTFSEQKDILNDLNKL